jgi:hypothetical protein
VNIGIALGIPFISKVKKVLARDTFNRPDSTVLGKADTGHTWEQLSGGHEVKNKQLISVGGGVVALSVNKTNYRAMSDIYNISGTLSLAFRVVDKDTYYFCRLYTNALEVYKFVGGVATRIGNYGGLGNGLVDITVEVVGSTFKCYLNKQLLLTVVDNDLATSTNVGFRGGGSESYAKNITVEEL